MSIALKIQELESHVDSDGVKILKELEDFVIPYDPNFHVTALSDALLSKEDIDKDTYHKLIDNLHMSTARYIRPDPKRFRSFKTDLRRFFDHCHQYIDLDMEYVVFEYLLLYHKIFNEPKKFCGSPRSTCHVEDCEGRPMAEQVVCPECGAYRALCKKHPRSNGRCIFHGGETRAGALNDGTKKFGRVLLYEESLNGELREMYIESVTDVNYLSMAPEMGALAARSATLMKELGDVDYLEVSTTIQQSIRKMRKAIVEEKYWEAEGEATAIETQLQVVTDDKRRWDEIAALSGRLSRLSETERKRLTEEQKMITVQEMYLLQQETLGHIRDTASFVAMKIVSYIRNGGVVKERHIREMFLSTLHGIMNGDISTDRLADGLSDEPVIIDAADYE